MTDQHTSAIPAAGPECAACAPLLPLLAHAEQRLLSDVETASARAHVAACTHCQSVLAGYERVELALRRLSAVDASATGDLREEIMASIDEREQPPASGSPAPALAVPPTRPHRLFAPASAVAAVVLVSVLAAALFAGRGWLFGHGKASGLPAQPTATPFADSYSLSMVVPDGAQGAWILGSYTAALCFRHEFQIMLTPQPTGSSVVRATPDPACVSNALLLHWDGAQWHRINLAPGTYFDEPAQVSVLPSGDAFVLSGTGVMWHLRDGKWTIDPYYALPQNVNAAGSPGRINVETMDMLTPQEGWAVGAQLPNYDSVILHFLNGTWTKETIPAPPGALFHGLSMTSASDGWAVGTAGKDTITEHYHNGTWTRVDPMFSIGSDAGVVIPGSLNQVQALPSGDAWAVGELDPSSGPGLILHWANGHWIQVDTGISLNILHAIDMISPAEGWVAGDGQQILHVRNGVWTQEGATVHGFYVEQLAMQSANDGWAVGTTLSFPPDGSALLHYDDGVWTSLPVDNIVAQARNG